MIDRVELAVGEHQRLARLDDGNAARRQHARHPAQEGQRLRRVRRHVHGNDGIEGAAGPRVRKEARDHAMAGRGGNGIEIGGRIDARHVEALCGHLRQQAAVVGRDLQHARARRQASGQPRREPSEILPQRVAGAAGVEVVAEQGARRQEVRELGVGAGGAGGEPERIGVEGFRAIPQKDVGKRLYVEVEERLGGPVTDQARPLRHGLHDACLSRKPGSAVSSASRKAAQRCSIVTGGGSPHSASMRPQCMRKE